MKRIFIINFIIFLSLIHAPFTVYASTVNLKINVILAQNTDSGLDPRLNELALKLKKILNFSSYRLLSEDFVHLNLKENKEISLPDNEKIFIQPLSKKNHCLTIKVESKGLKSYISTIELKKGGGIIIHGVTTPEGIVFVGIFY